MMKIHWKLLLTAVCLLALTACGEKEEPEKPLSYEMPELLDVAYLPEYTELDLGAETVTNGCSLGSTIYLCASRMDTLGDSGQYMGNAGELLQISADGAIDHMPFSLDFFPVDLSNAAYVFTTPFSVQTGPNESLWVLVNCNAGLVDDTDKWLGAVNADFLCQVDAQGSHLSTIDLTEIEEELGIGLPNNFALDSDGWFYFLFEGEIHVLNEQMEPQFSLTAGLDSVYTDLLVRFPDGRMGSLVREAKGPGQDPVYEMRLIDREKQCWGAAYPLPPLSESAYPGSGGYLFFVNSGGRICGWNEERDALEQVVDSVGAGTNLGDLQYFAMDPEGGITAVTFSTSGKKAGRVILTPVAPDSLPEKTTLTLACLGASNSLRNYVNAFNQTHQDCRIELVEYSDPHMPMEGYDRLLVDITAGNVPDILCLDRLPAEKFGAKGLFEDLWPYIDNDPELGRDALMSHVLECAEQQGKLYYVINSFEIMTAAAPAAAVGDRLGWTLEDLRAALAQMPEGCQAYSPAESKDWMLNELLNADMDRYVDWETGTCSFDSGEFQELLDYINSLDISPDQRGRGIEYTEETVLDGRQMLYYSNSGGLITNFFDVQRCEAVLGGPVSFVGNPKQDGSCGSAFYAGFNSCPLAITAACGDKEAAWSFLRELLLPRGVKVPADGLSGIRELPINREDFTQLYQRSSSVKEENISGRLFSDAEGKPLLSVGYEAVTQTEYEQIMELYDAIESMYTTDEDIWEIVSGEASAYFAGERSLEDTVARIQNRAQLYVNEQK